jgi:chromate transport protein ChrA
MGHGGSRLKSIGSYCLHHKQVGIALLMGLLPLVSCLITCGAQGHTLGEVYLPASPWNDELFYYKQVEGILQHGYPYGYFGFNESHARALSFAAWSPFLVLPWVLLGLLFGWNLLSPILFNIVLMGLAIFAFVLLVGPNRKQLGLLALLFLLFTPLTRYLLSGMPEIICMSLLILFLSLAMHYRQTEKGVDLPFLFLLAVLMTLMRPYLVMFMLLPCYFLYRRSRKAGILCSLGSIIGTGLIYALINYYWSAEYFTPLFYTDWFTTFFTDGLMAGLKLSLGTLWRQGQRLIGLAVEGIRTGDATGAYFTCFLAVFFLLGIQTLAAWRKKHHKDAMWYGYLAFCFLLMLGAVLLMYHKMNESSKHLLTFTTIGIFAVSGMPTRFFKKAAFLGGTFLVLFWIQAADPYEYQVPYSTQTALSQQVYWQACFQENLTLVTENVPNYDNSVIWTFNGETQEGVKLFPWQIYYELPKGFGISCCYREYVIENLDSLRSAYLGVVANSELDQMCTAAGYEEIGRYGDAVVYRLRSL